MSKKATSAGRSPVHCHLIDPIRAALEVRCNDVSKANNATRDRSTFFIGQTADEHGSGHALCEVAPDGTVTRHWGDAGAYYDILDNA